MANYGRDHIEVQYSFINNNSAETVQGILRQMIVEKIILNKMAKARSSTN